MTGEYDQHEDEKPFEELGDGEEAFILEDWDELDQVLAEVEQEVDDQAPDEGAEDAESGVFVVADAADGSPDDLLFVPTNEQESVGSEPRFSEESDRAWGGADLSPEEFGIASGADDSQSDGSLESADASAAYGFDSLEGDAEVQEVEVDFGEEMDFRGESGFFRAEGEDNAGWQSAGLQSDTVEESLGHEDVPSESWSPLGDSEPLGEIDELAADDDTDELYGSDLSTTPEAPTRVGMSPHEELLAQVQQAADQDAESGYQELAPSDAPVDAQAGHTEFAEDGTYVEGEEEAEQEYDPIYGAPDASEEGEAVFEQEGYEPDYTDEGYPEEDPEYAEAYVESDWQQEEAPVRRFPAKLLAACAALLLLGGVGTVLMKPEWFGVKPEALVVDRAEVARPRLALTLPPPSSKLAGQPAVETPPAVVIEAPGTDTAPPGTDPVAIVEPAQPTPEVEPTTPAPEQTEPVADPVAVAEPEPAPIAVDPLEPSPDGLVVIDGSESTEVETETRPELVPVGEELHFGEQLADASPEGIDPMAAGLTAGDHAFVQLVNGNFFVGNVKVLRPRHLTLRLAGGEVTLRFEELRGLGTVDSPEYRNLMRMEPGVIKLQNQNRLAGSILNSDDDNVVLETATTRIVVPKAAIDEVGDEQPRDVRVEEDTDDAWIRALIEQRLEKKRAENNRSRPEAAPGTAVEPLR